MSYRKKIKGKALDLCSVCRIRAIINHYYTVITGSAKLSSQEPNLNNTEIHFDRNCAYELNKPMEVTCNNAYESIQKS